MCLLTHSQEWLRKHKILNFKFKLVQYFEKKKMVLLAGINIVNRQVVKENLPVIITFSHSRLRNVTRDDIILDDYRILKTRFAS